MVGLTFHYRGGLGVANAWQGRKTCNQSYQELSCKVQTLIFVLYLNTSVEMLCKDQDSETQKYKWQKMKY